MYHILCTVLLSLLNTQQQNCRLFVLEKKKKKEKRKKKNKMHDIIDG